MATGNLQAQAISSELKLTLLFMEPLRHGAVRRYRIFAFSAHRQARLTFRPRSDKTRECYHIEALPTLM